MTFLTKINIAGAVLITLIVLGQTIFKEESTFEMNPVFLDEEEAAALDKAFEEAWEAQGKKYLDELPDVNNCLKADAEGNCIGARDISTIPFDWDSIDGLIDDPVYGLTIDAGEPPCVDTHLLTDVSCADKAAVIEFRKAQSEALRKKLQLEVDQLEKEAIYEEFGLREC